MLPKMHIKKKKKDLSKSMETFGNSMFANSHGFFLAVPPTPEPSSGFAPAAAPVPSPATGLPWTRPRPRPSPWSLAMRRDVEKWYAAPHEKSHMVKLPWDRYLRVLKEQISPFTFDVQKFTKQKNVVAFCSFWGVLR